MLLVGSVFCDNERSDNWYALQMRFLQETTKDFHHVVALDGKNNFYSNSQVIQLSEEPSDKSSSKHCEGLNEIVKLFESDVRFKQLLLIDSDAFPVDANWQARLVEAMTRVGRRATGSEYGHAVAAVVRTENLDTFAHPCVFFAKSRVKGLNFSRHRQTNLAGKKIYEVSSNVDSFYPLTRTNHLNFDQMLYGIYWRAFYHHGAGSRGLRMRYQKLMVNEMPTVQKEALIYNRLISNTYGFIGRLAGEKKNNVPWSIPCKRALEKKAPSDRPVQNVEIPVEPPVMEIIFGSKPHDKPPKNWRSKKKKAMRKARTKGRKTR